MRSCPLLLSTLALSVLVSLGGTGALGADSSPPPGSETPPQLWLEGAFGRVAGGPPDTPSAAAPGSRPLDTWMRRAPLQLSADTAAGELRDLRVVSQPLDEAGAQELLSEGEAAFKGPDRTGRSVVTASFTSAEHDRVERAWLVETPARVGGPELLLDIPGPVAELHSARGTVRGEPGHGCYVYLCVEVGYRPPTESLATLPMAVGETLQLRLDDDSAMAGWTGTLEPRGDLGAETLRAAVTFDEGPLAAPRLLGLEPTAAGEWLLELRADFDRERGWQWFLFRLVAE